MKSGFPMRFHPEASMSNKKSLLNSIFGSAENPLVPKLRDAAILTGWIAGIILIASLCWFLTQSVRSRFLVIAVNRVLEQSGDSRRLDSPVSPVPPRSGLGLWFTMGKADNQTLPGRRSSTGGINDDATGANTAGTRAYIFVLIAEGTFFPCVAVVNSEGKVEEFIPLTRAGERMIKRFSPGILKIYIRRIEGAGS